MTHPSTPEAQGELRDTIQTSMDWYARYKDREQYADAELHVDAIVKLVRAEIRAVLERLEVYADDYILPEVEGAEYVGAVPLDAIEKEKHKYK